MSCFCCFCLFFMYHLHSFLPFDIVYYIYIIRLRSNSINVVSKYYVYCKNKKNSLKEIINVICGELIGNDSYINSVFLGSFYNNLKIVLNSEYNRVKYNNYFWQCFTHMLSFMLMRCNNKLLLDYCHAKKNPICVYLNKAVIIWFELCKKYNIKLALLFNNINLSKSYNEYVYIKSRNILKISNFKKFLCSPNSLDNDEFFIENNFARNYIKQIIR